MFTTENICWIQYGDIVLKLNDVSALYREGTNRYVVLMSNGHKINITRSQFIELSDHIMGEE